MCITIKKMETDDEIRGKAFVHWKSWQEAYPGLVDQAYLDKLTLEKCEDMAYRWPENLLIAKDHERVVGFVGFGDRGDICFICAGGVLRQRGSAAADGGRLKTAGGLSADLPLGIEGE